MSIRRIALVCFVLVLTMMIFATPVQAAASTKNETVYALLDNDGSVRKIYVVNQLIGEYTDYGVYSEIKNLSTTSQPVIDADRISFPDSNIGGGLYYQGTMSAELPYIIKIGYALNGQEVDESQLSGANGELEMTIECSANPRCSEAVRDGLMAQLAVALDMQVASDITAPKATIVWAGRTANIGYTILPGESGRITVKANVHDFRMDPITMTLLKGTLSFPDIESSLSEIDDGFDDMYTGTDEMVEGTTELKDGMVSLLDGVGDVKNGLRRLKTGGDELHSGLVQYGSGLDEFIGGVQDLSLPSNDIKLGLEGLSDNSFTLAQNISVISDNLTGLSASSADLKLLAESLAASDNPDVAALAGGTLHALAAISELSAGLDSASGGMGEFAAGAEQAANGYASFHNGILGISDACGQLTPAYDKLVSSVADYSSGVSRISSGANQLYNSINGLPDDIQKLIDGQLELRDGIYSAKNEIKENTSIFIADDDPPVSFASPLKNHPESIQYILTTPGIKAKEFEAKPEEPAKDADFLTRLAALFN